MLSLSLSRGMSVVERWGVVPTVTRQNDAEHSFYVALYTAWLFDEYMKANDVREDMSQEGSMLVLRALIHDMPEIRMGDMPGPVKKELCDRDVIDAYEHEFYRDAGLLNWLPPVSKVGAAILKCADVIDALMFLAREMSFGNSNVREMFEKDKKRIEDILSGLGLWSLCKYIFDEAYKVAVGNVSVPIHKTRDAAAKALDDDDNEAPF